MREAEKARDARDLDRASALYQAILDRWGPHFGVLVQLGNALKDKAAFGQAEQAYRAALLLEPGDADCHLQLGHLMKLSGHPDRAAEYYAEANRLSPALEGAIAELRSIEATRAALTERAMREAEEARDAHDLDRAAALYQAILDRWGPQFGVLVQLGNALKDKGAFEQAEQAYRAALLLDPVDADCHLQLGHLMKLSGHPDRAAEYYAEANRLSPSLEGAIIELRSIKAARIALAEAAWAAIQDSEAKSAEPVPTYSHAPEVVNRYSRASIVHQRLLNGLAWRRN